MTYGYKFHNTVLLFIMILANKGYNFFCSAYPSNHSHETIITDDNDSNMYKIQAERLLDEYGNSVLRLAYSYLKNMSDAEDILQETLIQFIKTMPFFETASHEKAWILRVAINISKNKIKYNKIRSADELSENLTANEKEDLAFVWEAVKKLPFKYSEVIHLFYHEGYSTSQIADILSKNETTIRSLLYRGRIKLKNVLKEVYDFEE